MGYAIGHNVGVNTLSGGAIRFRAYSVLGLSAEADRDRRRIRHADVRSGIGRTPRLVVAVGGRAVGLGACTCTDR